MVGDHEDIYLFPLRENIFFIPLPHFLILMDGAAIYLLTWFWIFK